VNLAVKANIHKKPHPLRLPENIYGTFGEWEGFATPSRDARTKTSFMELRQRVKQLLGEHAAKPASFDYDGNDLPSDVSRAYADTVSACQIQYRNSAGKQVKLTYEEIQSRLFKLSFDPYHCPELRWGASGAELQSCPKDSTKMQWYTEEQRLRNQMEPHTKVR
jgi:hypothetical protein